MLIKPKRMILLAVPLLLALLLCILLGLFWPVVSSAASVKRLEDGLYSIRYRADYNFDDFIRRGGADSDLAVAGYVANRAFRGLVDADLQSGGFGCSTLSVVSPEGDALFGRNFDWGACTAMVVETKPKGGYASVSTVNMDFLNLGMEMSENAFVRLMSVAAPFAPMDGMNEKGLCVAVLMIEDAPPFRQDTGKPDLTTTTAVRLLLDQAADVEEAVALLRQYDLHASADMMVHLALSDAAGRSVVVEYIAGEMFVTETPVVTNFYLSPGEKYGVGSEESHKRYELLIGRLADSGGVLGMDGVRDALDRVSKHNFDSAFASTEWSIVYNQSRGEVQFFHRENFRDSYRFLVQTDRTTGG